MIRLEANNMFNEPFMIGILAAILIINLITLILVIKLMINSKAKHISKAHNLTVSNTNENQIQPSAVSGIVFCRNCGHQFDSKNTSCPNCHTER